LDKAAEGFGRIGSGYDLGEVAARRETETNRDAVCYRLVVRGRIGRTRLRASLQGCGVEGKFDSLGAARTLGETFGPRPEDKSAQLQ
jgi:hypothetical protein